MNTPNPALVAQKAVQPLPRLALWLLCAAYVLPGVLGRDPWKNADLTAVGYMLALYRDQASWLAPTMAGVDSAGSLLPYWIGAGAMHLSGGLIDPMLAARLPFAAMLAATLALVWAATTHLARTDAAQPLPFAFGGEADAEGYARAIADGAVLALISCLGLLQLGHETTPELAQLLAVALHVYSLAAAPFQPWRSRLALLAALPALAISGAAFTAVLLALAGALVCRLSSSVELRRLLPWSIASGLLAAGLALLTHTWVWRLQLGGAEAAGALRLLVWFTWPVWPMALWTLWQWRRHTLRRHVAVPLSVAVVGVLVSLGMGGSDRALLLALPALAILAAFALPTLRRSVSAAIDWFSVFFFSICALAIWVIYAAMQTGVPARTAANIIKLAPGFVAQTHAVELMLGLLGTLAWLWLVRWRTGRHRHALWKSLVLPASGVALCWLLLMTLWLPLLDYARSYRPTMEQVRRLVPAQACVHHRGLSAAQIAALNVHSALQVIVPGPEARRCDWLLVAWNDARSRRGTARPDPAGWHYVGIAKRPTDRDEAILVYRRD